MNVDRQLTLLRLAARVDPHLRQAVEDVENALNREQEAKFALYNAVQEARQRIEKLDVDWNGAGPWNGIWGILRRAENDVYLTEEPKHVEA